MFHKHKFLFIFVIVLVILICVYILGLAIPRLHIKNSTGIQLPRSARVLEYHVEFAWGYFETKIIFDKENLDVIKEGLTAFLFGTEISPDDLYNEYNSFIVDYDLREFGIAKKDVLVWYCSMPQGPNLFAIIPFRAKTSPKLAFITKADDDHYYLYLSY